MSNRSGISIESTGVSKAFVLIGIMVCDLIFEEELVDHPLNETDYFELNAVSYKSFKQKVLSFLNSDSDIMLSFEETILFYLMIDFTCRCFVSNNNEIMRELAKSNLELDQKEYKKIRESFIHYAQLIVDKINAKYVDNQKFIEVKNRLKN